MNRTWKPRWGTEVKVVLVDPCWTREIVEIRGKVASTPAHSEPDAFALIVPDSYVPLRVIRMRDLVSIDDLPVEGWKDIGTSAEFKTVGSRGDVYTVRREGLRWSCTCAGYTFRQMCRHIEERRSENEH